MEESKINVHLAPGQDKATIVLREGAAPRQLEMKAPIPIDINGTICAPLEFLAKRINTEQFEQRDCHIEVNRDDVSITLVINENNAYKRGIVRGKLTFDAAFKAFGINGGKVWIPSELGMFIKMNRAYFRDKQKAMELVTAFTNYVAQVNNSIERAVKENGNRTDNFAQVVNSNLPAAFSVCIPIFKGMGPETFEVETFAQVNGREVGFILISPGANETLEDVRNKIINEQLEQIRAIAPDIAIFEV